MDIYVGSEENVKLINSVREDLAGTLKIANIRLHPEKRCEGSQISPYDVYFQIEY